MKPLAKKTYASVELKKALEKGYVIDKIYAAYEYDKMDGLMKQYVGSFLKMRLKTQGSKLRRNATKLTFHIKP